MSVALLVGGFLCVCGVVFILAALAPGVSALAALQNRLELTGAFERGAALVSGLLFLASGGAVSLGFEQVR